jgi:hypothetical protein
MLSVNSTINLVRLARNITRQGSEGEKGMEKDAFSGSRTGRGLFFAEQFHQLTC